MVQARQWIPRTAQVALPGEPSRELHAGSDRGSTWADGRVEGRAEQSRAEQSRAEQSRAEQANRAGVRSVARQASVCLSAGLTRPVWLTPSRIEHLIIIAQGAQSYRSHRGRPSEGIALIARSGTYMYMVAWCKSRKNDSSLPPSAPSLSDNGTTHPPSCNKSHRQPTSRMLYRDWRAEGWTCFGASLLPGGAAVI